LIYGSYLSSHNISPEKAPNHPNQKQTMDNARRVAETKRKQDRKSLKRLLRQTEGDPTRKSERALLWEAAEGLQLSAPGSHQHHQQRSRSASARRPASARANSSRQQQPQGQLLGSEADAADERAMASSFPLAQTQRVHNSQGVFPASQAAQNGNARNVGGGALGDPSSFAQQQQQQQVPVQQQTPQKQQQQQLAASHQRSPSAVSQRSQQQQGGQPELNPYSGWRGGFSDAQASNDETLRRSVGRRGDYADSVVGAGSNSLENTTARTMSVLPLPEKQPQQQQQTLNSNSNSSNQGSNVQFQQQPLYA
jgi:hypothetical protein